MGFRVGLWACKAHPVFTASFHFHLRLTQEDTHDSPESEVQTGGGVEAAPAAGNGSLPSKQVLLESHGVAVSRFHPLLSLLCSTLGDARIWSWTPGTLQLFASPAPGQVRRGPGRLSLSARLVLQDYPWWCPGDHERPQFSWRCTTVQCSLCRDCDHHLEDVCFLAWVQVRSKLVWA